MLEANQKNLMYLLQNRALPLRTVIILGDQFMDLNRIEMLKFNIDCSYEFGIWVEIDSFCVSTLTMKGANCEN